MAYFHARSYSPFLFSFLSSILLLAVFSFCKCSGRVCLSDLGPPCILFSNPFFSSSSSSLLPFPEKCLRVCVFVGLWTTLKCWCFSFFSFLYVYRNSGTGGERQSAARKAKSDCLGSKPDLTIPVRHTSIT